MSQLFHSLRYRQIHLDFHTSPHVPGIGKSFDKVAWQETLREAAVDSITLFSKCHHGWSYHQTAVGKIHPHLSFDLLRAQYDATKEAGIHAPVYLSAGVDNLASHEHPEWREVDKDGAYTGWAKRVLDPGFHMMDFHSPYLDYLCDQIREAVRLFPDCDGIFLDIISQNQSCGRWSLEFMRVNGLDPEKEEDRRESSRLALEKYYRETTAAAKSLRADMPIFHNSGHIPRGRHDILSYCSHLELESLPTGGWGYDHFPMSARYAITQKWDFMGMTGKFHNTWGEFGGFKRPAALQYECGAMLAYGAKVSVGDQLHPNGEMNLDTYRLIGAAYQEVEAREPWCDDVKPVARIALVSCEINQDRWRGGQAQSAIADEGVGRMLLELHQPFVVLDTHADWSGFDLVVLPDTIVMTPANVAKAKKLLAKGGRIIAAGTALLDEKHEKFAVDPGAKLLGRSPLEMDYLVATALTPNVAVKSAIAIAGGAFEIKPTRAAVLAERREAYFNRTWEHYTSHQHAPDKPGKATPAAVISQQIAYFAHDIFTRYRTHGQPLYRDFFEAALRRLLGNKLPVETNLPTTGRIGLLEQKHEKRYVAHLLYSPTSTRGKMRDLPIELIEDVIPLYDTRVALRLPKKVKTVRLVPDGEALGFNQDDGVVSFTVPKFASHQMVELGY